MLDDMKRKTPTDEVRADLIAAIRAAFGDVRLGKGISLHQARALDDYQDPEPVRHLDKETDWAEIADAKIEHFANTFPFMDAESFRFHIPAFMIYALNHYKTSDSFAIDAAIYALDPGIGPRDHYLAKYELLSEEQKRVIARFLYFFAAHGEPYADERVALEAIRDYWDQYRLECVTTASTGSENCRRVNRNGGSGTPSVENDQLPDIEPCQSALPVLTVEDAQHISGTAYAEFRLGHYDNALQILQPFIAGAEVSGDGAFVHALLWGIAGDTYWEMGRTEESLQAYRRSAEIDPTCGSVDVYARHVADAQLRNEAPHAFACLKRAEELRGKSLLGTCSAFFIFLVFMPRTWWEIFFQNPKARRRLAKLAKQARKRDTQEDV